MRPAAHCPSTRASAATRRSFSAGSADADAQVVWQAVVGHRTDDDALAQQRLENWLGVPAHVDQQEIADGGHHRQPELRTGRGDAPQPGGIELDAARERCFVLQGRQRAGLRQAAGVEGLADAVEDVGKFGAGDGIPIRRPARPYALENVRVTTRLG
jgi:hypothetical protein